MNPKKSEKQNSLLLTNAELSEDAPDQKVVDEQTENKAPIQIIFEITLFGGGGLLAFGAILDAFSNALSIVTPRVTIVGTVVAITVAIIVILVKSNPNIGREYKNFINLFRWSNKEWFALIGIVFLLWTPYWLRSLTGSAQEENPQLVKFVSSNSNENENKLREQEKIDLEKERIKLDREKLEHEREKFLEERAKARNLSNQPTNNNMESGTSKAGAAIVFDPPTNVRDLSTGKIICSVTEKRTIKIYGSSGVSDKNGVWIYTDICGTMGVIHSKQISF